MIACMALFFSLGGAGLAASNYLTQPDWSNASPDVQLGFGKVTAAHGGQALTRPCPRGEHVLEGGFTVGPGVRVQESTITDNTTRWLASATLFPGSGNLRSSISVWALCVGG